MLTTILDETVNGWVLTIFLHGKKEVFVYERLVDAQEYRNVIEETYNG